MRKKITLLASGLFLGLVGLNAQTTCSPDRSLYVASKNTGPTGAINLSIGAEEKASQTYHYSGPGKVGGARVYGSVPGFTGVVLKVSLYNVDANGRPSGTALASAPYKQFYSWSPDYFDVNFSPAVTVEDDFALVVEIVHFPGWGHNFALQYTGNGEGLGEDLASMAGTSTGFNWASAMSTFGKDGDLYIIPKMINFNTPKFSASSTCVTTGATVSFSNNTQMTVDPMFNTITLPGYSGSNFLYTWDFGDGSAVSHDPNPSHTYAAAGAYTVTLTSTIDGWENDCSKSVTKSISVGLSASASSLVSVSCYGGNDGSLTISGNGGLTPYQYSINGHVYQSSPTFNALKAGIYTIFVRDANGCINSTSVTITQPAAISFTSASSTNASCGSADGSVLVNTSGGVAPVEYQLNSGAFQSSGFFSGLNAGGYTITAKDANGCTQTTTVAVNDAGGPSFNIVNSTQISCYGSTDGSISLSSLGGTGAIFYSINGGSTWQSSGNYTNLGAGTYTAMVKDAVGCSDIQVIVLTEPEEVTLTATSVALTCFESNDGEIQVTSTSGGTGVFSYSLNGLSYQSEPNFYGLAAGTYTVYSRDVANCTATISITVTQPTALGANVLVTNASCYEYQDGTITISGTGGTPDYTYGIGDEDENEDFVSEGEYGNLVAGTYPLTVTDANGCVYSTTATITQPTQILPVATTTNSTCGNANGGMLVTASGGSGSGYTYSLNGGTFGAGSFSGLAAGSYVILTLDGSGCGTATTATVFDSDGPSIISSSFTDVSCHDGEDGTITIGSVTGGTGSLQYSINGTSYQSSPVFSGLPAGSYDVTVKDALGCIGNISITLTEPNALLLTTTVSDATCHDGANGSITLMVGGGAGTLAYSIDGGITYQSGATFNGLEAGTYILLVKDAGGCITYSNATVDEPSEIHAAFSSLNVSCYGANNGAINIFGWGGTGSLQYSLNGTTYQTSNVFIGLSGGLYTVYVKDANGCVEILAASVYEPAELIVTGTTSDVTCAGGNNGVIDLTVTGGVAHHHYAWSNGINTEDNFNLTAGTYTVTVTDGYGCIQTLSFGISEPAMPVIVNGTVTSATGSSANGSINLTVTGGEGSYSYAWSNGATTDDVSGLAAGVYTVVVTDGNGCSASSTFIVTTATDVEILEALNQGTLVYPNPANAYLNVEVNGYAIENITLTDALGQIVYTAEPNSSKASINTAELMQGVYFVKISVNQQTVTKKVKVIR